MVPEAVAEWIARQGHGRVVAADAVAGGCINDARQLRCDDGHSLFLKSNPRAPAGLFAAEAAGLAALAVPGAPRVPAVHLVGEDFILLEDLPPGRKTADHAERFGRDLAALHAHPVDAFGFARATWCGDTLQPNPVTADGHAFYAEHRFGFQARLGRERGRLSARQAQAVEAFAARLPELVPAHGPALLHGDLWSGNAHVGPAGEPALIDPACYHGWPEAELAMTRLFGGFSEGFYRAYEEASDIAPDWRDRVDLHNVYHLLNHANIFGGGYAAQALAIVERYVAT